ncbi:MAG TPA: nucleotidyltransferase [Solirubrobacteraceae bacterium]
MTARNVGFDHIMQSLKRAAAILRDAEVPFVLGGSIAAWARGGPETTNDIDLMLRHDDAERALKALTEAGMRPDRPPEEWLLKAWDDDVMIDLIFSLSQGQPVDDGVFERAEELEVLAMRMLVMDLDEIIITKLRALDDHYIEFVPLVQIARALREKIDWLQVRAQTEGNPFAAAYFVLLEGLGIIERDEPASSAIGVESPQAATHAFHPEPEPYR